MPNTGTTIPRAKISGANETTCSDLRFSHFLVQDSGRSQASSTVSSPTEMPVPPFKRLTVKIVQASRGVSGGCSSAIQSQERILSTAFAFAILRASSEELPFASLVCFWLETSGFSALVRAAFSSSLKLERRDSISLRSI